MAEKDCEGKCPYCESISIDFIDRSVDYGVYDIIIYDEWECGECKMRFIQVSYSSIVYQKTEYEEIPLDERTLFDKG